MEDTDFGGLGRDIDRRRVQEQDVHDRFLAEQMEHEGPAHVGGNGMHHLKRRFFKAARRYCEAYDSFPFLDQHSYKHAHDMHIKMIEAWKEYDAYR